MGNNAVWMMKGGSLSSSASLPAVPTNWVAVAIGDFQGDGKAEVFWRNLATGDNSIWYMNGSMVAAGVAVPNVPPQWSLAGVGDFQDDGKADIIWRKPRHG